ncbi:MAG: Transcriptional regulatory protein ZraR [Candidatus Scalindua arabica]|uniref:Transcriptional regulatory protein ZraR n=1 Tax=Candidatus Scalindua arabica TaxID=1127984 RepID=A0A942A362_9BACT|nr:Transcriptional regulatory protein ZraR [Candidatus Scalindua arabica]
MSNNEKILVVDDLEDMRVLLSGVLKKDGYNVTVTDGGLSAVELFRKELADAVIMDIKMPGIDGIEAMKRMKKIAPTVPIILMTAHGNVSAAVHAVKSGAYDYVTKPFDNEKVLITLKNALSELKLKREVDALRSDVKGKSLLSGLMGSSDEIKEVYDQVNRVAPTDFTVIIYGETGSGKELIARAIHNQSSRTENKIVTIDCGVIPENLLESELFGYEKGAFTGAEKRKEGYVELASGSTLFLDEIGNLSLQMQGKLLRAIEEKKIKRLGGKDDIEINVRIIVAGNEKLGELVKAGSFREDLFHRLNEFTIEIPALRNRRRDIIYISRRFLNEINVELNKNVTGFSTTAIEGLFNYEWPGNVRELKNVIRKAVLLCSDNTAIEANDLAISEPKLKIDLPDTQKEQSIDTKIDNYDDLSLKDIVKKNISKIEKDVITDILKRTGGNKSKAARMLKIDYKTMHYKVKEYGIKV